MPVGRYTRRPDVFEAIAAVELLDAAAHDWASMPDWIRDAYEDGDILFMNDEVIINHPAGKLTAKGTDMIINHPQARVINMLNQGDFDARYQATD